MPKEKDNIDISQPVQVTGQDLLNLVALMSKGNADAIAEALAKLQPGYRSPEQKVFDQKLREDQRQIQIDTLKRQKREQKYCLHEVGQRGGRRNGEGAFFMLKLPTGEMIGVCCYCRMVISSANPDHQKYFHKANGTPAESGQVTGLADPIKAQLARLGPDERERVKAARAKYFTEVAVKEAEDEEL